MAARKQRKILATSSLMLKGGAIPPLKTRWRLPNASRRSRLFYHSPITRRRRRYFCYRARDDGGTGTDLGVGAMDGSGDSGIFAFISATADSKRLIPRAVCS